MKFLLFCLLIVPCLAETELQCFEQRLRNRHYSCSHLYQKSSQQRLFDFLNEKYCDMNAVPEGAMPHLPCQLEMEFLLNTMSDVFVSNCTQNIQQTFHQMVQDYQTVLLPYLHTLDLHCSYQKVFQIGFILSYFLLCIGAFFVGLWWI